MALRPFSSSIPFERISQQQQQQQQQPSFLSKSTDQPVFKAWIQHIVRHSPNREECFEELAYETQLLVERLKSLERQGQQNNEQEQQVEEQEEGQEEESVNGNNNNVIDLLQVRDPKTGNTLLHLAVLESKLVQVQWTCEWLIEQCPDLLVTYNSSWETPAYLACQKLVPSLIRLFFRYGDAVIRQTCHVSDTPLWCLMHFQNTSTAVMNNNNYNSSSSSTLSLIQNRMERNHIVFDHLDVFHNHSPWQEAYDAIWVWMAYEDDGNEKDRKQIEQQKANMFEYMRQYPLYLKHMISSSTTTSTSTTTTTSSGSTSSSRDIMFSSSLSSSSTNNDGDFISELQQQAENDLQSVETFLLEQIQLQILTKEHIHLLLPVLYYSPVLLSYARTVWIVNGDDLEGRAGTQAFEFDLLKQSLQFFQTVFCLDRFIAILEELKLWWSLLSVRNALSVQVWQSWLCKPLEAPFMAYSSNSIFGLLLDIRKRDFGNQEYNEFVRDKIEHLIRRVLWPICARFSVLQKYVLRDAIRHRDYALATLAINTFSDRLFLDECDYSVTFKCPVLDWIAVELFRYNSKITVLESEFFQYVLKNVHNAVQHYSRYALDTSLSTDIPPRVRHIVRNELGKLHQNDVHYTKMVNTVDRRSLDDILVLGALSLYSGGNDSGNSDAVDHPNRMFNKRNIFSNATTSGVTSKPYREQLLIGKKYGRRKDVVFDDDDDDDDDDDEQLMHSKKRIRHDDSHNNEEGNNTSNGDEGGRL